METSIPPSDPAGHPNGGQPMEIVGCLEMELDHSELEEYSDEDDPLYYTGANIRRPTPASPLVELAQGLVTYIRLWMQLYPRLSMGIGVTLSLLVIITWAPVATRRSPDMTRNHLERDYTKLATDYDLRKANIHHWCLFGGNENCYCEDPTQGDSREDAKGWSESHVRNKHHIDDNAVVKHGGTLDVVFLGGEVFQAWGEGKFLGRDFDEGTQIATYFNQTFRSSLADLQALSLGIYTDRVSEMLKPSTMRKFNKIDGVSNYLSHSHSSLQIFSGEFDMAKCRPT